MAVSAAELDDDAAAEADEAEADEAEAEEPEAEAEAEELELDPQLGLVFRVTPAPLHRVVAKVIVAVHQLSLLPITAAAITHSQCQLRCKWPKHNKKLQ